MELSEKVKKGLECCINGECNSKRKTCPYRKASDCASAALMDALAYIRELEAKVAELDKRCEAKALNATTAIRELEETKLRCLEQIKVFADKLAEYEKPLLPLKVGYLLKENPVWLEYNSGSVEICELSTRYNVYCAYFIGDEDEEYLTRADYNKTWRCWPRRPTDEERKAAEWDD